MSQDKYRLAEDVLFQKVAEETVILEPETGEYYTLNAVGTYMVEQLQLGHSRSEVKALVLENYQVTDVEVEQDLDALLANMVKQGLLISVASNNG